jgi:Kef-type K+ transport system membrane component KefB
VSEAAHSFPHLILLIGVVVLATGLIKCCLVRSLVPPLVGYLVLGFALRLVDLQWPLLSETALTIFFFLAKIGLFTLLFKVGLESDLAGLLHQLRRASLVCASNIAISGGAGYLAGYLLGLGWLTSLILAVALTATSVGVSAGVWQQAGRLNSQQGRLLIDTAELDDISGVVLMALLFASLPAIRDTGGALLPALGATSAVFLAKLVAFAAFCALFARFMEKPLISSFKRLESPPEPMIMAAGVALIIASGADFLGFSLAIGAFFAGLVFSRDPRTVKMEASFQPLYDFFSPFFFVGIGLEIAPGALVDGLGLGALLLLVAVLGKVAANFLPVWLMSGAGAGLVIGASMVPRAEIAMVIMQQGLAQGAWAVPQRVYAAMVVVTAGTCLLAPLAVRTLLERRPPESEKSP